MKHLAIIAALSLAACAPPPPICDRDAIEWDKWGEPAQLPPECLPPSVAPVVPVTPHVDGEGPSGPVAGPRAPDEPTEPDAPDDPGKKRGNNGLGNGDQTAPGNSGPKNRAENEAGNPGHASGKDQVAN